MTNSLPNKTPVPPLCAEFNKINKYFWLLLPFRPWFRRSRISASRKNKQKKNEIYIARKSRIGNAKISFTGYQLFRSPDKRSVITITTAVKR